MSPRCGSQAQLLNCPHQAGAAPLRRGFRHPAITRACSANALRLQRSAVRMSAGRTSCGLGSFGEFPQPPEAGTFPQSRAQWHAACHLGLRWQQPPELTELHLTNDRLTGPLPSSWAGNLPALQILNLSANELTGTSFLPPASSSSVHVILRSCKCAREYTEMLVFCMCLMMTTSLCRILAC